MKLDKFPREYTSSDYIFLNPDLINIDLEHHWINHGWKERRNGQFILTRNHLLGLLDRNLNYLEIGPYGRPFIDKRVFNVKYFDVLNKEKLAEKSINEPDHSLENIPEIDYVNEFGDLSIINEDFDIVISSHCLEHQPNLINHLKQVSNLLIRNGLYICMIPDYKYCFDSLKPKSTLIDVLEAHISNHVLHSRFNILLSQYYSTHNDPTLHWAGNKGSLNIEDIDVNEVIDSMLTKKSHYEDCHAWFLDAPIFASIFKNKSISRLTNLSLERCYETPSNSNEFIAIFKKNY